LWQKDLGINGKNTYGNGIIETPNHDYIVNGYIDHKASLPTVWITNKQYFVTLTDSAGNIKWQKQYGNATQNEIGTGIINCNTGCYLLGYQDSAAQLSAPPWFYEETIGMVNFIDKNGNLQWQKKYIDTTYETKLLNGFAIKGNEYVLLANKTRMGYDVTFNNNEPTIIKIDSVGNVKWKRQYYIDDSVNIDPHLITLCPDSGYMVNGFVNFTKSNRLADAYLLKVDKFGCLQANCQQWDGVEEVVYHPANEIGQLLVYPNPAGNQLTVGSNQYSVNTIEVTNVLGQVCISIINYKSEIINVAALPSGIYFIKATDNKGNVMNGKFVKE
jgi:hypothetical protein